MSDFGDEIINRLHQFTSLMDINNPGRKVIDCTIGEWLDDYDNIHIFDGCFLDSAEGKFLDLWGRDYNVPRRIDEDDESYRQRIVFETLGYLTANYLRSVYGLTLYSVESDFDVTDNTLVSDNPFVSSEYMTIASDDIQSVLSKKFVLGSGLSFIEVE